MANILKGIYVVLFLCVTAVCGEFCSYSDDSLIFIKFQQQKYCSAGCCGSSIDTACCPEIAVSVSVGVIAGVVVGSIVLVAMVVSIIVAVWCCCRKTQRMSGQVLQPVTTTATTVFGVQSKTTHIQQGSGQSSYGQPEDTQPGYGQTGYGQDGYINQGFSEQMPMSNMQPIAEKK